MAEAASETCLAPVASFPCGATVLRDGAGAAPLVLVSPTGGSEGLGALARALPEGFAVIGLDSDHVSSDEIVEEDVVKQASRFVDMLRQVQPTGPYRLAGFSFGAYVAYALAQALIADGHQVAYLGIIDTWPMMEEPVVTKTVKRLMDLTGKVPRRTVMAWRARRYVLRGIADLVRHRMAPGGSAAPRLSFRDGLEAILLDMHRYGNVENAAPTSTRTPPADETFRTNMARKIASHKRAIAGYRMAPIEAPLFLYATDFEKSTRTRAVLEEDWRTFAGNGLTCHWFSCGHVAIIREPMVKNLALRMGEDLARLHGER